MCSVRGAVRPSEPTKVTVSAASVRRCRAWLDHLDEFDRPPCTGCQAGTAHSPRENVTLDGTGSSAAHEGCWPSTATTNAGLFAYWDLEMRIWARLFVLWLAGPIVLFAGTDPRGALSPGTSSWPTLTAIIPGSGTGPFDHHTSTWLLGHRCGCIAPPLRASGSVSLSIRRRLK